MKRIMKVMTALLIAGLMVVVSAGCNTVKGMGRDLQKGGTAVEKAATKKK